MPVASQDYYEALGVPGDASVDDIRLHVPKKLTRRERELFEQLASTSKFDPRRGR